MKKRVGNVTITYGSDTKEVLYADGAEKELLKIFRSKDPQAEIKKILGNQPSWPMVYHLSNKRGGIIDWYEFKQGARILEVGAGMGAVTEALCQKNVQVTALEIDPSRATVNAERNKHADNLEVIVSNLQDYKPKSRFDYIVCVGVLEYSGKYIESENPYLTFMEQLRSLLSDDGVLLLAIENKLGLKYLAGAPEDHTGIVFDSINNYPNNLGMQTFSRHELTALFEKAGFANHYFYFPHPDYKLPHVIFSDNLYPGNGIEFPLGLLPTATPESRNYVFSEQAYMLTLEKEKLYPFFANSFLVESTPGAKLPAQSTLAYFGQRDRKDAFGIATTFRGDGRKVTVRKQAISNEANGHIDDIINNGGLLSDLVLPRGLNVENINISGTSENGSRWADYPFIEGSSLERQLLLAILKNEQKTAIKLLQGLVQAVETWEHKKVDPLKQSLYRKVFGEHYTGLRECVKPGVIDLNPDNIIVDPEGTWRLIDYEWVFDVWVPKDYIIGRIALSIFRNKYADLISRNYKTERLVQPFADMVVPSFLYDLPAIKNIDYELCYKTDCSFQSFVARNSVSPDSNATNISPARTISSYSSFIDYYEHLKDRDVQASKLESHVSSLEAQLQSQQQAINRLRGTITHKSLGRAELRARTALRKRRRSN